MTASHVQLSSSYFNIGISLSKMNYEEFCVVEDRENIKQWKDGEIHGGKQNLHLSV
jgi:hypothetical protein